MYEDYLRRLRRKAEKHRMAIRQNRGEEGGYLLIDTSDSNYGFDIFGGPVELEDIEKRLDWLEEDDQ